MLSQIRSKMVSKSWRNGKETTERQQMWGRLEENPQQFGTQTRGKPLCEKTPDMVEHASLVSMLGVHCTIGHKRILQREQVLPVWMLRKSKEGSNVIGGGGFWLPLGTCSSWALTLVYQAGNWWEISIGNILTAFIQGFGMLNRHTGFLQSSHTKCFIHKSSLIAHTSSRKLCKITVMSNPLRNASEAERGLFQGTCTQLLLQWPSWM